MNGGELDVFSPCQGDLDGILLWNRKWEEGQVPQARHTVQGKTIHSEKYRPGCSEGFVLAIRTGDGATGIQVIRRAGNSREI